MIEKEFVPYEQALALKELGFNEPCFGSYDPFGSKQLSCSGIYTYGNCIAAPLYQQAFSFFREKYELDSTIALVANGYGFYIHKNRNYTNKGENYGMYITYEEAELACLIKLIEIVKNK